MARKTRAFAHGIELYDLTVFEAVARQGSIGGAARALGTVQPAVTTRIQRLEAELGTRLFDRHPWGVSLTNAGERLVPYAKCISDLVDLARDSVRHDSTGNSGLSTTPEVANQNQLKVRLSERTADKPRTGIKAAVSPSQISGPSPCQQGRQVQCHPLKP